MKLKAAFLAAFAALSLSFTGLVSAASYYVTAEKTDFSATGYTNTTQASEDGEGEQIKFGYQPHENFAVEVLYGQNEELGTALSGLGATGDDYYGIMLRPGTALSRFVRVNATFGLVRGGLFDDFDSISWGFGFEITPIELVSIVAGWTHMAESEDGNIGLRVEGLNLGLKINFGGDDD